MFKGLIKTLKERPIVSIILCVALSEIIQFVFSMIFDITPAVYYGITVIAMLTLFVIPVILYMIDKKKRSRSDELTDKEKKE